MLDNQPEGKIANYFQDAGALCIVFKTVNTTLRQTGVKAAYVGCMEWPRTFREHNEYVIRNVNPFQSLPSAEINIMLPDGKIHSVLISAGSVPLQHSSFDPKNFPPDTTCIVSTWKYTYHLKHMELYKDDVHSDYLLEQFHPANVSYCQHRCNAREDCLVFTVSLDVIVDNQFVYVCYLYRDAYPYMAILSGGFEPTTITGFKYCNVASTDLDKWVIDNVVKERSNNPFYHKPDIGVKCTGMDVPHHCRRMPVGT